MKFFWKIPIILFGSQQKVKVKIIIIQTIEYLIQQYIEF